MRVWAKSRGVYVPLLEHPQYFGEQLSIERPEAWKESNRRLYKYYRAIAPELPKNFREMEPLFLAVICACNAGLSWEALHEVYVRRIQLRTPPSRLKF